LVECVNVVDDQINWLEKCLGIGRVKTRSSSTQLREMSEAARKERERETTCVWKREHVCVRECETESGETRIKENENERVKR